MLLTIHNLPSSTRYIDVKSMLSEKCGLSELILDNLVSEGNTKKVTVGLADEGDAAILVRKINGLYINGQQLYVEDKRKKRDSEQPYRSSASLVQEYQESVAPRNPVGDMAANMNTAMMMNYNMAGMYMPMPMMPMDQNMSYMGYGGYMAIPTTEPRPPAPANERGLGGFAGDGGAPGGRPREQPRDAPRPRDRKRRASPERPAEDFNRPSRWKGPSDAPPRREKSPPRHAWPAREPPRGPERPRDFDQYQPRPEHRRTDPEWQSPGPRWEDERRPPRAQPEPQWEPPARWEPQPERAWQPEPEWREPPVDNDNRRFNEWEGGFPPESEGNYPGPDRFEPDARRFGEEYPPAHHETDFRDRPREQPDDRRPRHDEQWEADNRRDVHFAPNHPGPEQPAWERPEEPHRPSRPSRPLHREPRPPGPTRKERRQALQANPPKRPHPERERGPADWNQVANDYPPSKKPRENNFTPRAPKPRQEPAPKPPPRRQPLTQSSLLEHKPKKVTQIINKDQTSRGQATAKLYKYILSGINQSKFATPRLLLPGIVKELKTCIRSRIDVMLGEELTTRYEDIIERYRKKYPVKGDKALFHCMKDKVSQRLEREEMAKGTGENAATVKLEKSETGVKVKPETENANVKKPKALKENLPRHEMTDKQIINQEKQIRKLEFTKKDHYKMDALTDKIVDEELGKIKEIFASECAQPANNVERAVCNSIAEKSVEEFLQTARLHLAKRILDIRTGLAVRIFADGKLPRRCFIKEYLKPYRIERMVLKKNKRGTMYVANVGSFEHYDHLCNLQYDVIDNTPVTIRSMYLVGPPPKLSKNQIKQRRRQFINSQVEPRQDYIVPPDTEDGEKSQAQPNKMETVNQSEDAIGDVNADTMEDFTADDFDGVDFGADFSADNLEDENANDNDPDPEGLNIADIKEEDLEEF